MTRDSRYNRSEKGRARYARYVRTPRGKANHDAANQRNNPRRVGGGVNYLGMAPRAEQAQQLNSMRKEFRDRQKQSRA